LQEASHLCYVLTVLGLTGSIRMLQTNNIRVKFRKVVYTLLRSLIRLKSIGERICHQVILLLYVIRPKSTIRNYFAKQDVCSRK